jgi:hypothetical protein
MLKRKLAAMVGLAVAATLVAPSSAQAATEIVVYKDQIVQPDTRSAGHVNWPIGGGIRLSTDDNTSNAKATFAFDTHPENFAPNDRMYLGYEALSHDVNVKSGGDQAEPGMQIYAAGGLFVWETVYQPAGPANVGTSDIWMTNGSPAYMRVYAPSCDRDPALETMTSDQAIAGGHCTGGSGSAWHGSEQDWAVSLQELNPSNEDLMIIRSLGESLGSGVKGNVLVSSISYGDIYAYSFSRQNAPVVTPEPVAVDPTTRVVTTIAVSCRTAVFTVTLPEPGENEFYAPQTAVGFRMLSAGQTVLRDVAEPGETITRTVTFTRSTTNVPRVKLFTTAPGQAPTAYPNTLEVDQGVNRNCNI